MMESKETRIAIEDCYQAPYRNCYGCGPGMLAAVIDCHGNAAAAWFYHRAQGLMLGKDPMARSVTASITVNYRKPTPMGVPLRIEARLVAIEDRKVRVGVVVLADGSCCCEGEVLSVVVRQQ